MRALLCLTAVALLAGCARGDRSPATSASAVPLQQALPVPEQVTIPVVPQDTRLGPNDEIAVDVFGVAELSRTSVVIDASGNIALPLIGTLPAAGRTPVELSNTIADRLRGRYLKNPRVAVDIRQSRSQLVTIEGAVAQPGVYPVVGRLTLLGALATARGMQDNARARQVVVFRTINGERMAARFDVPAIRAGGFPDPQIYGNDLVVVGENNSSIRRVLGDVLSTLPVLGFFTSIAR